MGIDRNPPQLSLRHYALLPQVLAHKRNLVVEHQQELILQKFGDVLRVCTATTIALNKLHLQETGLGRVEVTKDVHILLVNADKTPPVLLEVGL